MATTQVYRITEDLFGRFTEGAGAVSVARVLEDGFVPPPVTTLNGDISTIWQTAIGYGDWSMTGPWLTSGLDLDTALLLSLFSDRTAAADDKLPDATNDRRGWWGDIGETVPIGSRLWLLDRAKLSKATPLAAADYIKEALQWMLDDGVAAQIDVLTEVQLPSMLAAQITIHRQNGVKVATSFAWVWQGDN